LFYFIAANAIAKRLKEKQIDFTLVKHD
jgi:hypothetical protein